MEEIGDILLADFPPAPDPILLALCCWAVSHDQFGQWAMSRSDVCNFQSKAFKGQSQWVTFQLSPALPQQLHRTCIETKEPQDGSSQDAWGSIRKKPALDIQDSNHCLNKMSFYWVNLFCSIIKLILHHIKLLFSLFGQKIIFLACQIVEFMIRIKIIRNHVKDKKKKKITWTEKVPWIKFGNFNSFTE